MSTLEILQDLLIEDYALARERLTPDAPLDTLGVDSLGVVELMFRVEDRFGIQIAGDPPADMRTLGDVARFVDSLVVAQAATDGGDGATGGARGTSGGAPATRGGGEAPARP